MECQRETNLSGCNCSYEPCPRKGVCCKCVEYHRAQRQLPACFFTDKAERTYNRSFEYFADLVRAGKNG